MLRRWGVLVIVNQEWFPDWSPSEEDYWNWLITVGLGYVDFLMRVRLVWYYVISHTY